MAAPKLERKDGTVVEKTVETGTTLNLVQRQEDIASSVNDEIRNALHPYYLMQVMEAATALDDIKLDYEIKGSVERPRGERRPKKVIDADNLAKKIRGYERAHPTLKGDLVKALRENPMKSIHDTVAMVYGLRSEHDIANVMVGIHEAMQV